MKQKLDMVSDNKVDKKTVMDMLESYNKDVVSTSGSFYNKYVVSSCYIIVALWSYHKIDNG